VYKRTWDWWRYSDRLADEVRQCTEEGRDVGAWLPEVDAIMASRNGPDKEERARAALVGMERVPVGPGFAYDQPVSHAGIVASLPADHRQTYEVDESRLRDRLRGAFTGRAAGCLLGIPVEGWTRERIAGFARDSGQWPLTRYLSSAVPDDVRTMYGVHDDDPGTPYDRTRVCWIDNVAEYPVDDDMNYTMSALRVFERYGPGFTSYDVAESWLYSLPVLHTCTAERVAYQNILNQVTPPESGVYLNPYREWIGAQIRADVYGYAAPGHPARAAEYAYRDAVVSHTANGVYGAMYIAALLSLAATDADMGVTVAAAMGQIPPGSRLAEGLRDVVTRHGAGDGFDALVTRVYELYDPTRFFDWCSVIPNAMLVTAACLCFPDDFGAGICNVVLAGFDTDCNGATVGSVLGMRLGLAGVDPRWTTGLGQVMNTSVSGYHRVTIDDAAERVLAVIRS